MFRTDEPKAGADGARFAAPQARRPKSPKEVRRSAMQVFEARSPWRGRIVLAVVAFVVATFVTSLAVHVTVGIVAPGPRAQGQTTFEGSRPPGRGSNSGREATLPAYDKDSMARTAFLVQDEDASLTSLKEHIDDLDVVFPDWFRFTGESDAIQETVDPVVADYLETVNVMVLPTVANLDAQDEWVQEPLANYLETPANRVKLAESLLAAVQKHEVPGINLDLEFDNSNAKFSYTAFVKTLTELFHSHGLVVTADLPLTSTWFDYAAVSKLLDLVVLMAYDEHWGTGTPGPIASDKWFADGVVAALKVIPKEKMVVALGQYAYDWNTTAKTSRSLSFGEMVNTAKAHGARIQTDAASLNTTFTYTDGNGDRHSVWALDAVTLWNQMHYLQTNDVLGVGFWRLGLEDDTMWDFYGASRFDKATPSVLTQLSDGATEVEGEGEFLDVTAKAGPGRRTVTVDAAQKVRATYDQLPAGYNARRYGHSPEKLLVLTFDDGPDPVNTPPILDVLNKYGVKGTFFMVGDMVVRHPAVVARASAEGHTIGNHTYHHIDTSSVSAQDLATELAATDRAIRAVTLKEPVPYRSPYNTESTPSPRMLQTYMTAIQLGHVVVTADIDSKDYENFDPAGIVASVEEQVADSGSNIVVFHDGGGQRAQTAQALDRLIPELRAQGYTFGTLEDLEGLAPGAANPPIPASDVVLAMNEGAWILATAWVNDWIWTILRAFFALFTALAIFKLSAVFIFATLPRRRRKTSEGGEPFQPPVTVLVPAYNEAKVIGRTLKGLLDSDYPTFKILVVDDGSTDDTAAIVQGFAQDDPRVSVVSKRNGGKYSALNLGFQRATTDIVVSIDADTILRPDTMRHLVAPMADPGVDAVCGNIRVGNVTNALTGFQSVEYVTMQNFDRRAFEILNCITVVPGATGAWRREKVLEVGGYSGATLTEDQDLTLTLLEHGGRAVAAPAAVSLTEAPNRVKDLYKQRLRWIIGTYQCAWKHRRSLFRGSLGWVALPNVVIFQILFTVLGPVADIVLLHAVWSGAQGMILPGLIAFLAMDLVGSLYGHIVDRAPLRGLLLILIARFYYRPILYFTTMKAILDIVRGRRRGWGKLDRTNSVVTSLRGKRLRQPLAAPDAATLRSTG